METTIFDKLNEIFQALNDPTCSDEDRKNINDFLNEFIQEPESLFIFIQFLSDETYSEQTNFFAFSGLEKMIKHYWRTFSEDQKNQIIQKILPLILIPRKVTLLILKLLYSKINDESYTQLWNEIFLNCKNELSQENVSIEKIEIVLLNISCLSELLRNKYRDRPVDSEYLVQFNEITSPFFDLELTSSEKGLSIVLYSIRSIVKLFGRSLTKVADDSVDQRILELCQFLFKIYETFNSYSEFNDQQLSFLQSCSSEIYSLIISLSCRTEIKNFDENGDEIPSQIIQSIMQEWKPQMLSQIFDLCLSIFNKDPSKHFEISKIIRPLTIDEDSSNLLESFFVPALKFISIPEDEKNDFFNFPDIYYQSQYQTVRDEYGNLRNNTILIYQIMFSQMSPEQIEYLFQNCIQISEEEIFLVAKNAKFIIEKGGSEILFCYITEVLHSFSERKFDLFIFPTVFYLFSKLIKVIKFGYLHKLVTFCLNILGKIETYQKVLIPIMVSIHFLYKLKKTINNKISEGANEVEWANEMIPVSDVKSIFPDEEVLNLLFKSISYYISSDIFKLIKMIAEEHQEIYPQLTVVYEPILKAIMDEIENYESYDTALLEKSQIDITQMFSLLISIIEHNTDSGIEEELFNVLSACLKASRVFDIIEETLNTITLLIQLKSEASIHYLKRILSFISENGEEDGESVDNSIFRKSALNFSIPFIVFMSNFPSEFIESGLLIETYKILIGLMNEEVINDAYDDFGLTILLSWLFQLQPQILGNEQTGENADGYLTLNTSFFLEYLESRKNRDEAVMESAMMNLALTFILLEKIDLDADFVERWLNYIKSHSFLRKVDVQFHMLALQFFINQGAFSEIGAESNFENLAIEIAELLQSNPDDFIHDVKSNVANEISLSNIDYPIFSLFTKE